MYEPVSVSACVNIRTGCSIDYSIFDEQVEFHCGSRTDGFEFVFDAESLRDFVDRSTAALAEMEIKKLSRDLGGSR